MKRKYSNFFIIISMAFMLTACGNRAGQVDKVISNGQKETSVADKAEEPELADNEEAVEEIKEAEERKETVRASESAEKTEDSKVQKITVEVGGHTFHAALYDNETAKEFTARLPLTLHMDELNGNEKYYYMDEALPADSQNVGSIRTGDIMLYGSDCLVLFFEDFSTSYSYTEIGHIDDSEGFAAALKDGTVEVDFRVEES